MYLKWVIAIVLILAGPKIWGQKWSWPKQEKIIKNTCLNESGHLSINTIPDIEAIPLNIHDFGQKVSNTPEVKLMREAGIPKCSIKIKFLLDESGCVLCYILEDKCHPVWEVAILKCIGSIEFWPAYRNSQPIPSEIILNYNWRFEW